MFEKFSLFSEKWEIYIFPMNNVCLTLKQKKNVIIMITYYYMLLNRLPYYIVL